MFMSCFSPVAAEVRWSNWGSWTTCTKSCGGGRSERQRSCTGALTCSGVSVEERLCNSNSCPGVCFINTGSILCLFYACYSCGHLVKLGIVDQLHKKLRRREIQPTSLMLRRIKLLGSEHRSKGVQQQHLPWYDIWYDSNHKSELF